MALQHLRSSTANKRPLATALSDGQLAVNTEATSPGLFFKNASGSLVKVGPVHVGATAPNASPASGGETGNTVGEQWLDTSGTNPVLKIWDGSSWASEIGEFVSASGDTMTGALVMDNQQQVRFRETTANGTNYIAIQAPASVSSDKTLTLPDVTGTLVSTGDTGTVTSTMLANGTIVNEDVNASAAIAGTKISPDFGAQSVTTTGTSTAASFIPTSSTVPTNGVYLPAANSVGISTNSVQRVAVDANGNVAFDTNTLYVDAVNNRVAIGSTTPGYALEVAQAASSTINIVGGTSDLCRLFFSDTTVARGFFSYDHADDSLRIGTAGSERLRITSAGLVGIGTTTPGGLLHVESNLAGNNQLILANIASSNSGAGSEIVFTQGASGFAAGKIQCDREGSYSATTTTQNSALAFFTAADGVDTERLRITSTGQVRLAGAGITFNGDTATANELDDYEEGTFTPTITGSSTAGTGTYTVQVGTYTKIGNRVLFMARMAWTAHTGTGNILVSGLPFTSNSTANSNHPVYIRSSDLTSPANTVLQGFTAANGTTITLQSVPVGGGTAAAVAMDTSADLMISGHYYV